MIRLGIEQEILFKNNQNKYIDFENADYNTFKKIVDGLPYYKNDNKVFTLKSTDKIPKRWYIEGFERFDNDGNVIMTIPNAIEIRTTPHYHIEGLLDEFSVSFKKLKSYASHFGMEPVLLSYNPYEKSFNIIEELTPYELKIRSEEDLDIAINTMKAHGMHVNISIDNCSTNHLNKLVKKITYYLPFIIPYSFASPFCAGQLFNGISYSNYVRAETRKLIYLKHINSIPIIEIKAFDSVGDRCLFEEILGLVKGLILDDSLNGELDKQDGELLKRSAKYGFHDKFIRETGKQILMKAKNALANENYKFEKLEYILESNITYSHKIKRKYLKCGDIVESISDMYDY